MENKTPFQNLIDYHLHTSTIDGRMNEYDTCDRVMSLGIHEIAFTNHVILNRPDHTISPAAFINHWAKIQECQQRYPQLVIRLGIEMDYYLNREDEIDACLKYYESLIGRPLDFVLGSIHELHGCFFSTKHLAPEFFRGRNLLSLYFDYFETATRAVKCRLFDIMAHPDLIKKFTNALTPPVEFETYRSAVEPFIEALLAADVGIEINTKGMKHPVKEIYPSISFLKLYIDKAKLLGVEPIITLSSDAHKVGEVGLYIAEAADWLRSLGVKHLVRFDQHHRLTTPI